MSGFTTTATLSEMINKFRYRKRRKTSGKKKKKKRVLKDKKTKIKKKYLSGLKGAKRSSRARLLKSMASLYRSGATIISFNVQSEGKIMARRKLCQLELFQF